MVVSVELGDDCSAVVVRSQPAGALTRCPLPVTRRHVAVTAIYGWAAGSLSFALMSVPWAWDLGHAWDGACLVVLVALLVARWRGAGR